MIMIVGNLRNDHGDGNEYAITKRLIRKNNRSAPAL